MSKSKMKIGIVGYGYVGKSFYKFFKNHYDVITYDPSLADNSATKSQINECDLAVICVPTPEKEDGSCDTSIVEEAVKWIDSSIIIIKSTVSPGTTDSLNKKYGKKIVFSPEYAGESSYWSPYAFHNSIIETPFFIFGGDKDVCNQLVNLYLPICGPTKKYVICTSMEAELAKYVENTFYATKVTFFNEIYDICEKSGVTWNTVRELFLLDPRVNPMHTMVLKNNRGFGGKCYPKDLNAFIKYAETLDGVNPTLLKSVKKTNEQIRYNNE